jgi:hypothetical protein
VNTRSEEIPSFLKKRSKRLLVSLNTLRSNNALKEQKFFGSFFQKRTFFLLSLAPGLKP